MWIHWDMCVHTHTMDKRSYSRLEQSAISL